MYLNIDLEIKDGFHIYSVHPDKSLSPTFIEITDSLAFSEVGVMLEPSPNKKCDKSFNQYIFYPIEIGNVKEYWVTEIQHHSFGSDTLQYFLKEQILMKKNE